MVNIAHHSDKNCFVLTLDDTEAILEYRLLQNNAINFTRTYVPDRFRGQGVAEALVRQGLSWAREQGYSIQASCWYVNKFLR